MTRRILLVALLLSSTFTFSQVYGTAWPYGPIFPPILTPLVVELPPPVEPVGVITYGPLAPVAPLVAAPILDFGWTSTFVGASNATPPNQVGATNSTLAQIVYGSSTPDSGNGRRARAGFDTGAAFYTAVSYGDARSLGEVAAHQRKRAKPATRMYTNDDISRLKNQDGSTLSPQTVTPANPNPQR